MKEMLVATKHQTLMYCYNFPLCAQTAHHKTQLWPQRQEELACSGAKYE